MSMATFMEFLGHRKYNGGTFLNVLNNKVIAAVTHSQELNAKRVVDNEDDFQKFVDAYKGRSQVYISVNPVRRDLEGYSKDVDVVCVCNLYIDLDLEKPAKIDDAPEKYPADGKHYAAREDDLEKLKPHIDHIDQWLASHGFKTGYHDHTGNGHRWLLPIPAIDLSGCSKYERDELKAKIKTLLHQIAVECGIVDGCGVAIDSVFDFRRITGVPSTLNLKLETTARKNRIREPFRGVERGEDVALHDYILNIEIPKPEPHAKQPRSVIACDTPEYWMSRDMKLKQLYEGDTSGYPSRSEAELALAVKLVYYRFNESEIEDVLLSSDIGKAAEKKKNGHKGYIEGTIKKAFELETKRVVEALGGAGNVPRTFRVKNIDGFNALKSVHSDLELKEVQNDGETTYQCGNDEFIEKCAVANVIELVPNIPNRKILNPAQIIPLINRAEQIKGEEGTVFIYIDGIKNEFTRKEIHKVEKWKDVLFDCGYAAVFNTHSKNDKNAFADLLLHILDIAEVRWNDNTTQREIIASTFMEEVRNLVEAESQEQFINSEISRFTTHRDGMGVITYVKSRTIENIKTRVGLKFVSMSKISNILSDYLAMNATNIDKHKKHTRVWVFKPIETGADVSV